ncbi:MULTISPECIES: SanA/YdcF family protein [Mycobacteriales]|uniref:ElyC/SanA/YdcF family protein n=1 Tax=Rhodococcus parequi TaxID=3137122 RepID=A0ABW9F9Q9_9NOCA|nr:ElyC/SanA/YdcF family protein [Gordonia sp. UBA6683]
MPLVRVADRIGRWTAAAGAAAVVGPALWIAAAALGRMHAPDRAPTAPVVVVLGARVHAGRPMKLLQGRLDATARLIHDGKAAVVLVSGDAAGRSGDEIAAMVGYLVEVGVPRERIVADPFGLDTHDTCVRAARTFGIGHALFVTQPFHLPRTVALARAAGIDAHGVCAGRAGGRRTTLVKNIVREILAYPKAARDALLDRDPKVCSPPDDSVTVALSSRRPD